MITQRSEGKINLFIFQNKAALSLLTTERSKK